MAAAQPDIFSGQDFSLKGDKNRFVLPPQFRKTLKAVNADYNGGKTSMFIVKHDEWECLIGFGGNEIMEIWADQSREKQASGGSRWQKSSIDQFTFEEVPFDGSGRFVLPDGLAAVSNIDDQIFFQGGGSFFTMWSPGELAATGPEWKNAQLICSRLAARELAKAKKS